MNIPRPEYPNPIFERENWVNLNGTWEFQLDEMNTGAERKLYEKEAVFDGEITVPFCPESPLSGVNHKEFMLAVWYRKKITLTEKQLQGNVFLRFGAVDFRATVYVNGIIAGTHFGGYTPFSVNLSGFAKAGENVITVRAEDDTRSSLQARGKQSELFYSHGCDYTRTTGIWQTVYLEFVERTYIKSVKYYPDVKEGRLFITAEVEGSGRLTAEAFFGGNSVGKCTTTSCGSTATLVLELSEKHLWEVGKGSLYDLTLTFGTDKVKSYFGLRQVRLEDGRFLINGKSVFQRLVLDQGFYPDGVYTAPTEEALINDIKLSMKVGFNGARLHQKIFEPRFLYHCDRLGYIVWGEHGNWGLDVSDYNSDKYFLPEWIEAVNRDFCHPAIVGWCPFNETWDYHNRQQDNELLRTVYRVTKAIDTTRPCIDTSGNYHVETDVYDVHDYDQNPVTFKAHYDGLVEDDVLYDQVNDRPRGMRQCYNGEPVFISEYGGIQWSTQSSGNAWGYGNAPKTIDEFYERYRGLTEALLGNKKLFGFCYTQLTDVEQEQNGIYNFDRTEKFDSKILKEINSAKAAIED